MPVARETKPVLDAVNDTIGTLSDLLASLRAHAKQAAAEAKVAAKAAKTSSVKAGKKAVRKAGAVGDGLLNKAAKVWHDITATDDSDTTELVVSPRARSKKK